MSDFESRCATFWNSHPVNVWRMSTDAVKLGSDRLFKTTIYRNDNEVAQGFSNPIPQTGSINTEEYKRQAILSAIDSCPPDVDEYGVGFISLGLDS